MPVGQVGGPFKAVDGMVVLRVDSRTDASRPAFEADKTTQRQQLLQSMRQQRVDEFLTNLRESVTVVDSAVVAKAPTRALEDTYADTDVITLYTPGTWVPTGSTITKGAILIALLSWAHQLRLAADAEEAQGGALAGAAFVAMVGALVIATVRHPRREIHVLAIETDTGGFQPRGFNLGNPAGSMAGGRQSHEYHFTLEYQLRPLPG